MAAAATEENPMVWPGATVTWGAGRDSAAPRPAPVSAPVADADPEPKLEPEPEAEAEATHMGP